MLNCKLVGIFDGMVDGSYIHRTQECDHLETGSHDTKIRLQGTMRQQVRSLQQLEPQIFHTTNGF